MCAWALAARLAIHRSFVPTILGRYSLQYAVAVGVVALIAIALTAAAWLARDRPLPRLRLLPALGFAVWCGALSLAATEALLRTTDVVGASLYEEIGKYMRD